MVKQRIEHSIGFFRATALGGVLFILPLAVVVGLLGYVYSFVVVLHDPIKDLLPVSSAAGIAGLFGIFVAAILLACFVAGLMAHRAIGRTVAQFIEKYLTTFFPKYAIYKDLLAGNIGGTRDVPSLKPVLVQTPECQRIAFESDRMPDNSVVVFFPGAPDTWIGTVGIVSADKVEPLNIPFNDVVGLLEQLGRNSSLALSQHRQLEARSN